MKSSRTILRIASSVLAICLPLISMQLNSQSVIQTGMIKMELTEVASDDKQFASQLEMLEGSETFFYFNDKQSLVKTSMLGGMVEISKLTYNDTGKAITYVNSLGDKMMVESPDINLENLTKEQKEKLDGIIVEYDVTDTKDILGYKCNKAMITGGEDYPISFVLYVTDELNISSKMVQGLEAFDLNGFPLEYSMNMEQVSMTYQAQEISENLDESVFVIDESGYRKVSLEEFMKSMAGFGGIGG